MLSTRAPSSLDHRLISTLLCLVFSASTSVAWGEEATTPEQSVALEIFEREHQLFTQRGERYTSVIESIVRREQLQRLRRSSIEYLQRYIDEEARLATARRESIALLEAYLEEHPSDPEHSPAAMLRLAQLYAEGSVRTGCGYSRAIELLNRLVADFSGFRRADHALYLLGLYHVEQRDVAAAHQAWLHLVCSNRYRVVGSVPTEETDGRPTSNVYQRCRPVATESPYTAVTWIRLGEHHLENDSLANAADLAITAFENALGNPGNDSYPKALLGLARALQNANRFSDALRRLTALVEHIEENDGSPGTEAGEMWADAIRRMAAIFATDLWDDSGSEGPRGVERLRSSSILPQDRPWIADVYYLTGHNYMESRLGAAAVAVWERALERWPGHRRAPSSLDRMHAWYRGNGNEAGRARAFARLIEFGPGGSRDPAGDANASQYPEHVQAVHEIVNNAIYDDAVLRHSSAQELRQRGIREESPEILDLAAREYALAAEGYRGYLERYPNDPDAYEIRYNLAEALYFGGRYREAAEAYRAVRDSSLDDRFRQQAAFRHVKALEAVRDAEENAGTLQISENAPEPEGEPPRVTPRPVPQIIRELNTARDEYITLFPDNDRARRFRDRTARVLFFYGHWEAARQRLARIYDDYCAEHQESIEAWRLLINMAGALNDLDEAERLAQMDLDRSCNSEPPPPDPRTETHGHLVHIRGLRAAVERFNQARDTGRHDLYEEAARMLIDAADSAPEHMEAPFALNNAALAYETVHRYESAHAIWQRIVNEYPDSDFVDSARFRLAYNSLRLIEPEMALTHFGILARSSTSEAIRRDSILNTAMILGWLQHYNEAAPVWRSYAVIGVAPDARSRAEAAYRAAEMSVKSRDWSKARRDMREFLVLYRMEDAAAPFRVRAALELAHANRKLGRARETRAALKRVTKEFLTSGEKAGSVTAGYAAEARFLSIDERMRSFERLGIGKKIGNATKRRESLVVRAVELQKAYENLFAYRRPRWTVAASCRIGQVHDLLAEKLPTSEAEASSQARERAVAEYEKCLELARRSLYFDEHTEHAHRRLWELLPTKHQRRFRGKTAIVYDNITAPPLARLRSR